MYFRVLGPVEIWDEDRRIPVGTSKAQHVLAILLLASGLSVSARSLADRLWDGDPPAKERETLQVYISRIRQRLRDAGDSVGVIRASSSGGYLLDVPAEFVDARQFDQAVTRARAAASDPEAAVALFRQAESLWRGEPLAGLTGQWADGTRRALSERRRSAVLTRIDLELLLGNDLDDLVSELAALTATGGVDQTAVGLLMRALARAGRLADALSTFRTARTRLREELGVDPSPELRSIHHKILRGESDPPSPRRSLPKAPAGPSPTTAGTETDQPAPPPPNTLDRDPRHLVGRETELADLLATVRRDLRAEAGGVAIYALDGMPGIGKTTLAVRAAHLLSADCPDGQIQLNFRSHHPHQSPISPFEALRRLLDEIGAPAQDVGRAESIDTLAALWRRRIHGRRLLLLLDDVQDAAQVDFLLPTAPGAVVLLTSRRRLSGVSGFRQHSLSTLPDDAARALLVGITERSFALSSEADLEALERFTARCGGVPLAITVSAAHLRKRPNWTLSDLVARLTHPGPRSADDQITGPVDTAIALSYYSLPTQLRTLLRRLAGNPGPDIGLQAAAALADADPAATDLALDTLVEHHLVEETTRHRYRLHDLIREFALDRGWHEQTLDDVEEAVHRAFRFYLSTAEHANRILHPYYPTGGHDRRTPANTESRDATIVLDSRKSVRTWLDSEAANLTALLEFAMAHGWREETTSLLHVLAGHLDRRGHWGEAIRLLCEAAGGDSDDSSAAPSSTEDFVTKAQIHTDLAGLHARTGELDKALVHATKAVAIWTANGDRYGQAEAMLQTGRLHWLAGRRSEAVEVLQVAVEMFGSVDAPDRRAAAEYHLGIGLFELGRLHEAFDRLQRLLSAATALGDGELRCVLLINLGKMHLITGDGDAAMAYFDQAQPLATESGDPRCLAALATNIGAVHRRRGRADLALASFREAFAWSRPGADGTEAEILIEAAAAHTDLGDLAVAAHQLGRARQLAEGGQDPLQMARVNLATGALRQRAGDHEAALRCYTASLAQAEAAQAPLDQAHALRAIGEALAAEEPAASRRHLLRAQAVYRRLGLHQAASAIALTPPPR